MSAPGGLSYWLLASIVMRIWICNFEFIKMEHNCLWMSWLQDRFEYTSADVGTGKRMGAITNPSKSVKWIEPKYPLSNQIYFTHNLLYTVETKFC